MKLATQDSWRLCRVPSGGEEDREVADTVEVRVMHRNHEDNDAAKRLLVSAASTLPHHATDYARQAKAVAKHDRLHARFVAVGPEADAHRDDRREDLRC